MFSLAFLAPMALALVCALAPAARASDVKPRIVGGIDAGSIPYQVAVFNGGGFCGGVVLDASTVITAAHCVVDLGTTRLSPVPDVQVVAGTSNLASPGPDTVVADAQTLSLDSQYNPDDNDHDIAKIELATPLWTTLTPPPAIQPINIVNDTSFQTLLDNLGTTPITATVSGWGCTSAVAPGGDTCPATLPDALQSVDIPLIDQATCQGDYTPVDVTITANMFCAGVDDGSGNKDSCFGDSGGPLTIDDPDNPGHPALAGLVDSGNGCAQDTFPGIYTRVSALTDFVTATDPVPTGAGPSVTSPAAVGQTVTCDPGSWTGAPTFRYRFFRDNGSGSISALTLYSSSATFAVPNSAGGSSIFCQVEATGTNAVRVADSAEVAIPVPPPPPPVQPPPPPPPPPVVDSSAPTLRIVSKRCTKTSCTVKVHVADASPSSGIGTLKATLGWSKHVKCKARKRSGNRPTRPARTCTERVHKSIRAKAGSGGNFTIVAKHLRPGTGYTFTLVPFDKAGNRPQFSTITNVRTKSRHSSGLLL